MAIHMLNITITKLDFTLHINDWSEVAWYGELQLSRKLYWAEDGKHGPGKARIAQSNMDGSQVQTFYSDVLNPAGLEINYNPREDR